MSGSGPKCSTRVRSASKVSRRASKGIEGYRRSSKAIEGYRRPSKGIEGHRRVSRGVGEFVVARGVFPLHLPTRRHSRSCEIRIGWIEFLGHFLTTRLALV